MSMRGLLCVRPADTHSPQGQVTLLSLLRPIPGVTTCDQRLGGTAACAFTLAGGIPQRKRLQMRVTSPRESSSEFRPKAPSTITTHAHHHTFLASESEKGLGAGVSRAGKEQARRVGQTMRDPSPGSNPKAQSFLPSTANGQPAGPTLSLRIIHKPYLKYTTCIHVTCRTSLTRVRSSVAAAAAAAATALDRAASGGRLRTRIPPVFPTTRASN